MLYKCSIPFMFLFFFFFSQSPAEHKSIRKSMFSSSHHMYIYLLFFLWIHPINYIFFLLVSFLLSNRCHRLTWHIFLIKVNKLLLLLLLLLNFLAPLLIWTNKNNIKFASILFFSFLFSRYFFLSLLDIFFSSFLF